MQWGRTSDRGRCWTTLRASWSGRGRLGRAQGIRPQGERKGRGVGSQECSIICGKELKSPGRLLRVLPRSQLSKVCSGDTGSGAFARPALHRRPGGPEARRREPGARPALPSPLPLAPGCCRGNSLLLAASFRLSAESVNSTFLISESLEKRHSTAAGCTPGPRGRPPHVRRQGTPEGGGKEPRARARVRGRGGTEEKEGQRAKTPLERDRPLCPALGTPGNTQCGR